MKYLKYVTTHLLSSFCSLLKDGSELEDLGVRQDHGSSSRELTCEWASFTSHFTQQFEELNVEVGDLWTEVKLLERTVREFKVRKKGAALNIMLD